MNAVTERPAKINVVREGGPSQQSRKTSIPNTAPVQSPPTRACPTAAIEMAFGQVESLLGAAHLTDENHEWSGDSCRLLRVAHGLAAQAHRHPPVGHEIEQFAFDIAALIRAARMVPGDSESAERAALVDQAAVHLNWLTECDTAGQNCCDPGVPRPAAPNAVRLDQTPGTSDEAECIELARQATYEITKLAETMQLVANQLSTEEDHPITHGLMARIIVLSEITFHAAALHGRGRSESAPLKELQRAFKGAI